ncbi:hypothetical protein V1511DRAFT_489988 [Dipodascopsis uninucleata]
MALPASLDSLSVREAIADAIYRAVGGVDTADHALFESAFTADAIFDLNGNVMDGLDDINSKCYDKVSKLDTSHLITNIRIDIKDGKSSASVTASALAQHYRQNQGTVPDSASFLAGSLYFIDCIKDDSDGLWKIKHWKLKFAWTQGDYSIMTEN